MLTVLRIGLAAQAGSGKLCDELGNVVRA